MKETFSFFAPSNANTHWHLANSLSRCFLRCFGFGNVLPNVLHLREHLADIRRHFVGIPATMHRRKKKRK